MLDLRLHCKIALIQFMPQVADGKLYFVKFYAPWCGKHQGCSLLCRCAVQCSAHEMTACAGHCKRLAPAWGDLGQSLAKDDDIVVAHVDCTQAKSICSNAKVEICLHLQHTSSLSC